MRKLFPCIALVAALFTSCGLGNKDNDNATTDPDAMADASREQLEEAISDRDELLQLTGDIQANIDEIKQLENIVSSPSAETPDRRAQVRADLDAIRQALIDKQARLDQLEKKLKDSSLNNQTLVNTIAQLRQQIENQTAEIDRLNTELKQANTRIAELGTQVDSLNTTVTNVTSERDAAEEKATQAENDLNRCYYAVGSSKELKDHKILQGGFLKKTKIMAGDFDNNFFTTADKRSLKTIPLYSKKAEVMTQQPKDSYTISDRNGQKVLTITNPTAFWQRSNYLVVKID